MSSRVGRKPDGSPVITINTEEGGDWTRDPEVRAVFGDIVRSALSGPVERQMQTIIALEGYHVSEEVKEVAERVIAAHPRFEAITRHSITYALLHGKDPEDHTIHAWAKFVKAPGLWCDLTGVEAVVWVNQKIWAQMEPNEREAIIAHELCHFGENDDGNIKTVDHDVEEFVFVARHFGAWRMDLGQLRLALAEGPESATA